MFNVLLQFSESRGDALMHNPSTWCTAAVLTRTIIKVKAPCPCKLHNSLHGTQPAEATGYSPQCFSCCIGLSRAELLSSGPAAAT